MILIATVLIAMSIEDGLTMHVNDHLQLLLLITIMYIQLPSYSNLLIAICFWSVTSYFYPQIKNYIGGADIKLICNLTLLYGLRIIYVVQIASLLALLISKITNKRKIAFIPYLSIGAAFVRI